MKHQMLRSVAILLVLACVHTQDTAQASTLSEYVTACTTELELGNATIPSMNCRDGVLFHPTSTPGCTADPPDCDPRNDYVNHQRVTDDVDAVLACRWSFSNSFFFRAEMIVHNRKNGKTCFFEASKDGPRNLPTVPPAVAVAAPPDSPEALYWEQPAQVGETGCVACHTAGPYIASPDIVDALGKFGLLNDGHDVFRTKYQAVGDLVGYYSADGLTSELLPFSTIIQNSAVPGCAQACHAIQDNPYIGGTISGKVGTEIPSIHDVNFEISSKGLMAPSLEDSAYRWINADNAGSDAMDIETFTASKKSFAVAVENCAAPTKLEAHAVGSDAIFSTTELAKIPDRLRAFNTREGLVCYHADQTGGKQCNDYSVRYLCSNGEWTGTYNSDSNSGLADNEARSRHENICTSVTGLTSVAIEATTNVNGATLVINGPNDKLAQFSPAGLICKNADQVNGGQCSNYVVRYRGCRLDTDARLSKLMNVWTNPATFTNRYLTTTSTANNSETRAQGNNYQWPSQDWMIEVIAGNTVRLRDMWSGKYLTASSNNDQASIVVQDFNASLQRQQWEITAVLGSATEKRLRNLGSNRYLTVGNYSGDPYYAPMLSQSLSNQNWASQRWVIQ